MDHKSMNRNPLRMVPLNYTWTISSPNKGRVRPFLDGGKYLSGTCVPSGLKMILKLGRPIFILFSLSFVKELNTKISFRILCLYKNHQHQNA